MEQKKIPVSYGDPAVTLTMYFAGSEKNRPAILVLPGGGYQVCAEPEGAPIARRFARAGYAAFVLEYSTLSTGSGHTVFPEPLRQVARSVAVLRERAEEYGIDPRRVTLFGASAGGHLAVCYGNEWQNTEQFGDIAPAEQLRPDASILLYPAVSPGPEGTMPEAMFGHKVPFTPQELERCDGSRHVGPGTPPTALFHSATDPTVPMAASLTLFSALRAAGIPAEVHIFGSGEHAYGLGEGAHAGSWPELALRFLSAVFSAPETFEMDYARRQWEARHWG